MRKRLRYQEGLEVTIGRGLGSESETGKPRGRVPGSDAGFTCRPDARVFYLFAALNAGGYDEENNPSGMHPVRVAVRDALAGAAGAVSEKGLEAARLLRTMASQMHQFLLLAWVLNRDTQDLTRRVGRELWEVQELAGPGGDAFAGMLKDASAVIAQTMTEALRQLPLAALWERHLPAHVDEAKACFETGLTAVRQVDDHLRPASRPDVPLVYVPNLLDSYWYGYAVDGGRERYVVAGPSEGPNAMLIRHEYAHLIVNPVVYAQTETLRQTEEHMGRLVDPGDAMLRPYPTWAALVAESLTEAVACLADDPPPESLAKRLAHAVQVRHLPLAERFVESLRRLRSGEEPAESVLPQAVREVLEGLAQ